ncbi:hypothetical protein POM88_000887 [Heracleum sosnowskyi]|uniref:RNase H type-1 domain-containing protein n=1 Tax=Heracleum sosnowskyi TaxID=360622 RepID=A0AAD8N9U8_9APIA|nr:hypothetical protein POM88_000887 [Heracleum sosnowskyi]
MHGKKVPVPCDSLDWSSNFLVEYKLYNKISYRQWNENDDDNKVIQTKGWSPPSQCEVKINVDAGVNSENGARGFGIVARDKKGVVLGGKSIFLRRSLSVLDAELWAILEGIVMVLFREYTGSLDGLSFAGFCFFTRSNNLVAHLLAKLALDIKANVVWNGVLPSVVHAVVCAEAPIP